MKVRIYKPSKTAMQSGRAKTGKWVLEYETTSKRRPEDLMGWSSSGDTLNQVQLNFETCGDAIAFAQEKSWNYTVSKEHERSIRPRNYADNFRYRPPEKQDTQ